MQRLSIITAVLEAETYPVQSEIKIDCTNADWKYFRSTVIYEGLYNSARLDLTNFRKNFDIIFKVCKEKYSNKDANVKSVINDDLGIFPMNTKPYYLHAINLLLTLAQKNNNISILNTGLWLKYLAQKGEADIGSSECSRVLEPSFIDLIRSGGFD